MSTLILLLVTLLQSPEVKDRLAAEGSTVAATSQEQLVEHLKRDIAKWARVVKTAGIKLDAAL